MNFVCLVSIAEGVHQGVAVSAQLSWLIGASPTARNADVLMFIDLASMALIVRLAGRAGPRNVAKERITLTVTHRYLLLGLVDRCEEVGQDAILGQG